MPNNKTSKPTTPAQPAARLADKYIRVCPAFFERIAKDHLTYFNSIPLRVEGLQYHNTEEDTWIDKADFEAEVWFDEERTLERFVYVPHQGRLYACENVLEISEVINDLIAHEAVKVIKPQ